MNWIKTNWTILAALVTMGAAWGDQVRRVNNVEDAIIAQTENNRELKQTREQVIRQDEQLKAIKESQKTTEQLMRDILESNRAISRKIAK